MIGTSTVFPRFRLDRTVANLYFARKSSAALAKPSSPRALVERRVMVICLGSDPALDVGFERINGTTQSARNKRKIVEIIVVHGRELLPSS